MALIERRKLKGLVEAGQVKPEHQTGLYLAAEDSKRFGGTEVDQAIIIQKARGQVAKVSKIRNPKFFSDKKRLEAATLYAALGNIPKCAAMTKVPENILRKWVDEDWFLQIMSRIKREENVQLDRKITDAIDKAMDQLKDRIENGDTILNIKTGTKEKIPMGGRDLAIVTGTIFDKRQLIRGEATKIVDATTSEQQLELLAKKFIEFAKAKKRPVKDIEGEVLENDQQEYISQTADTSVVTGDFEAASTGSNTGEVP